MSVERIDHVSVQCPGCSREVTYTLEDEFIVLDSEAYCLDDDFVEIGGSDVDDDIMHFWAGFSCEDCGKAVKVVSFLADPSEINGSTEEVGTRVKELRREKQVVKFEYPLVDEEAVSDWEEMFYEEAFSE